MICILQLPKGLIKKKTLTHMDIYWDRIRLLKPPVYYTSCSAVPLNCDYFIPSRRDSSPASVHILLRISCCGNSQRDSQSCVLRITLLGFNTHDSPAWASTVFSEAPIRILPQQATSASQQVQTLCKKMIIMSSRIHIKAALNCVESFHRGRHYFY